MVQHSIMIFMSVVEEGSFTGAAKKHYVSQSAVSQQIDKLEEELGFLLFDRKTYRPTLTDAGRYYYESCKNLLSLYQNIEQQSKKIASISKNQIEIGITGPYEKKHLPLIIERAKKSLESIDVNVKKYNFITCIDLLEDKKLDIAFGIENDFKGRNNISYHKLIPMHVCMVCAKHHPLANLKEVTPEDISDYPIVSLSKNIGNHFYDDFIYSFKLDGVLPNIIKEFDELDELLLAVQLNEGIAFVAEEVMETSELVKIPIKNSHHHADFCVGIHKENMNDKVNMLMKEVITYFSSL